MPIARLSNPFNIASAALKAESMRMNVAARNVANAESVSTAEKEAWRRKQIVLSTDDEGKITFSEVIDSATDLKQVFKPNHPHADSKGFVSMSNVEVPMEMMDMMSASRAYQANVASMKRYNDMTEATLQLLR